MNLDLTVYYNLFASQYKSGSQISGRITERWASDNLYCPKCGRGLIQYPNNKPVYDFYCDHSNEKFVIVPRENFQLKSTHNFPNGHFSNKIQGGEYGTAMHSMKNETFPSLILLHYEKKAMAIEDAVLIHRLAITPSCIKPRKPLSITARRAGWQGSIITLDVIPELGRIMVINNGNVVAKSTVQNKWSVVTGLLKGNIEQRGWIADMINFIDRLPSKFSLNDIYKYENELASLHPQNRHVKDKIRQQLQILRDRGFIKIIDDVMLFGLVFQCNSLHFGETDVFHIFQAFLLNL